MKISKKLLALAFVALLIGVATAALYEAYIVPTTGKVESTSLQLFEMDGTTVMTTLDWGSVSEGENTMQTKLSNTGTLSIMVTMTIDSTDTWLAQTWDQEGTTLAVGEQITVTWTLTLTSAPEGATFNYNTIIAMSPPL